MKLYSGKRRGFSKSVLEVQAVLLAAAALAIRKDVALQSARLAAAFLQHFTRRTVGQTLRTWVKFVPSGSSPALLSCLADGYWSGLVYRVLSLARAASLS